MIVTMPTLARSQQCYDHRLRNLVQRTGDVRVVMELGVPRSTARGWLVETPRVVVCLDATELTCPCRPHGPTQSGAGTSTGDAQATATRAETHGAAPARAGRAASVRVRLTEARLPEGRDKLRILR